MLNLYDYLTELDNKRIENYIKTWGVSDYIGNDIYLSHWRDSNKKLFKLLGGNLIYSIPVSIEKDKGNIKEDIANFIDDSVFYGKIVDMFYEDYTKSNYKDTEKWIKLFYASYLLDNKTDEDFIIKSDSKCLKIQKGTKTIKAIKKIIDFKYPENKEIHDLFEEFRLEHSRILNDKFLKGDLCFSIHPLDFLTMSDNNSNWSSCMSWQDGGCYHTGTVEMMNSNVVICVYLKSDKDFYFGKSKTEEYAWNNKKWRQLFYCNKDIIVSGKAYPYYNEKLTFKALETLRDLARVNWNQEYRYGIERYNDMKHINNLFKMIKNHYWVTSGDTKKHNIIFETNAMYNDMFNDKITTYWCVRNKVKKNVIINLSGKVKCAKCGCDEVVEKIDYNYPGDYEEDLTEDDEFDYNSRFSGTKRIICVDCYRNRLCENCFSDNRIYPTVKINVSRYKLYNIKKTFSLCKNCFTQYLKICPECNKPFLQGSSEKKIYKFSKDIDLKKIDTYMFPKPAKGITTLHVCPQCYNNDEVLKSTYYYVNEFFKIKILKDSEDGNDYNKYLEKNLIGFTDEDFESLYKGLITEEELIKQKIN